MVPMAVAGKSSDSLRVDSPRAELAVADRPILGIDPGLHRTGYAFVCGPAGRCKLVEAGLITLDPRRSLPDRLAELAESICTLIENRRPRVLACEELYAHYKHPRTAILMGHARGVILAGAAAAGLGVLHVSATQVKKTLTGYGRAGKTQIQQAVSMTLGLRRILEPPDVADAVAIGVCGLHLFIESGSGAASSKSSRAVRVFPHVAGDKSHAGIATGVLP